MATQESRLETHATSGDRWLTLDEILADSRLSRSTVYALMAAGDFPAAIKPAGQRCARWCAAEYSAWKARCAERRYTYAPRGSRG